MSLLVNPRFRAFDANGDPLSGGKLYSYTSGTSNAKSLYTDRALATPATNPLILDANGEAAVYGSGSYKLILKNSSDVTQWTMDYVSIGPESYDSPTFDDLTVSDDALVGGDLTVTGAMTAVTASVTGAATAASVTATGTVTAADLTCTDDLTVGDDASVAGDLAVTGIVTADSVLALNRLYQSFSESSTSGTGEDTLYTYTVTGGTLSADGMGLKVRFQGMTTSGAAGTITIKQYIGATAVTIASTANILDFNSPGAIMVMEVWRATATTAHYHINLTDDAGTWRNYLAKSVAVTWADDQEIKITAECSDAADSMTGHIYTVSIIND